MHHILRCGCVGAAITAALSAQQFIGFAYNGEITAVTRGALGTHAGEVIAVIKGEEYAGWGTDVAGQRTISSLFFVVQDQNFQTAETFSIKLYPEDAANPGFPNLAAGVAFATNLPGPGAPMSGVISAEARVVTPTTPVSVPIVGSGDVFVSFVLPGNAGWPNTDGLSLDTQFGYQPSAAFTVFDVPGSAQQPTATITVNNTHMHTFDAQTQQYFLSRSSCLLMDVAHSGTGGAVLGITNQASLLGSANPAPAGFGPAPGTGDFMSGVSPDVTGFTAGRADDIAFDYFRGTAAANSLVLFLGDLGAFGTEVPLGLIFAGGTGTICVSPTFLPLGVAVADTTGEAFRVIAFPAALRPQVAGIAIVQQALELDATGGLHLSPCGRQQL